VRTPFAVIAVLLVALLGLSLLTGDGAGSDAPAPVRTAPVGVIAKRVEALRGLRYTAIPRAAAASPAEARRDGLHDFDRSYPQRRRRADEEMLTLLGLAPAGLSLRDLAASLYGEGVAGYYDPRTKKLRTVDGPATGTRVLAETVLAHELNHALEDQRFRLLDDAESTSGGSDAALARLSLVEGTATAIMNDYMRRYFTPEEAFAGALASAFADTGSMPPFLEAQTVFPYLGGERFVRSLRDRAGGRWDLVDLAERTRPPASTEQVMHPDRYIAADQPEPVRLAVGALLGARWTRAGAGTWGELQTREMLAASGGGGAAAAAQGWGGDRWELWRSAPLDGSCEAPCRGSDVLVMRWRWDTPRDEAEFHARLRRWVHDGLSGASAAVVRRGGSVTLAIAPSARLAARVARRA
jgi:hypothetical protein